MEFLYKQTQLSFLACKWPRVNVVQTIVSLSPFSPSQNPLCLWTPSLPPTPPLRSSWSGSLPPVPTATSPTTGSSVVSSLKTTTSKSLTTVYKVSIRRLPCSCLPTLLLADLLHSHTYFSCAGMKLPSRTPTHLDSEDEQKWNHTDEPASGGRCCACPKTDNQLKKEQEEKEFQKTFENYLHNEVFSSRYTSRIVIKFYSSWHNSVLDQQLYILIHILLSFIL